MAENERRRWTPSGTFFQLQAFVNALRLELEACVRSEVGMPQMRRVEMLETLEPLMQYQPYFEKLKPEHRDALMAARRIAMSPVGKKERGL